LLDQDRLSVEKIISADVKLAEVKLSKGSSLSGHTLPQAAFRHTYRAIVLAIRRGETVYYTDLEYIPLMDGDVLLIKGQKEDLAQIQTDDAFILSDPESPHDYHLEDHLMMMRVPEESALVGKTLQSNRLGDAFGLSVQGIIRQDTTELMPSPEEVLRAGDTLLIKGKQEDLLTIEGLQNLEIETKSEPDLSELETDDTGLIEAVLSPHSTLAGKAIRELNFRAKYGLTILAIWRGGRAYRSHLRDMKLQFGDALLLFGSRRRLHMFGAEPDFLVLSEDALPAPRLKKAPFALLIMALVLIPLNGERFS